MQPKGWPTALFAIWIAGCGGDGSSATPDAASAGDADVDPAPNFDAVASSIRIIERSPITGGPTSYSTVTARFASGPPPFVHREEIRDGACRLLLWDAPFCDPPCTGGLCGEGGLCQPFPTARCAGTVEIDGLRRTMSLSPDALCGYFGDATEDLFEAGSEIAATATGDDVEAFELTVRAPATDGVTVDGAGAAEFPDFAPDTDFALTWSPVDPGSRVRLTMAADLAHGQPASALVECDAPDTGSLVVPGAIVNGFADPSRWSCGECPTQTLTRYRRASRELADGQQVELVVGAEVQFFYWGGF